MLRPDILAVIRDSHALFLGRAAPYLAVAALAEGMILGAQVAFAGSPTVPASIAALREYTSSKTFGFFLQYLLWSAAFVTIAFSVHAERAQEPIGIREAMMCSMGRWWPLLLGSLRLWLYGVFMVGAYVVGIWALTLRYPAAIHSLAPMLQMSVIVCVSFGQWVSAYLLARTVVYDESMLRIMGDTIVGLLSRRVVIGVILGALYVRLVGWLVLSVFGFFAQALGTFSQGTLQAALAFAAQVLLIAYIGVFMAMFCGDLILWRRASGGS